MVLLEKQKNQGRRKEMDHNYQDHSCKDPLFFRITACVIWIVFNSK